MYEPPQTVSRAGPEPRTVKIQREMPAWIHPPIIAKLHQLIDDWPVRSRVRTLEEITILPDRGRFYDEQIFLGRFQYLWCGDSNRMSVEVQRDPLVWRSEPHLEFQQVALCWQARKPEGCLRFLVQHIHETRQPLRGNGYKPLAQVFDGFPLIEFRPHLDSRHVRERHPWFKPCCQKR